jgi:diguanylate cyclase (GGDEF)-like protein
MTLTWISGRNGGFILTAIAMLTWVAADLSSGRQFSAAWIPYVNALTRLATYSFVTVTVAKLHVLLLQERELAARDPLTGLLNRRAFTEAGQAEVDRARRYGRSLAVVFVDLDNFKQINDRRGHATGDAVLQAVAQALRSSSRASDQIARLGGDEFALLLPEVGQAAAADIGNKMATAMRSALADYAPASASIGVAWFESADRDFPKMIDAADALMYEIKAAGKNDVRVRRIVEADSVR